MDESRVCQLKRVFIWLPEAKLWTSVSSQSLANNIYFYMRFLYNFGVAICKYHGARPLHSFNKCWKLYSADICKNVGMSFLGRQSCVWASRASSAQKLQGLRVVCSKKFSRATFFVFWGTHLVDVFLNNMPVKRIWRKSSVWACMNISKGQLISEWIS